jgi:hypothetical protein
LSGCITTPLVVVAFIIVLILSPNEK